ncbi:lysozyme c-1-like isoform X2 [Toxorhynchites rutilus septentrionalis]|uniref:lysozyme c-1-like isoform X2 n=1 Tax=Toxorhynchites rutilus septentrionalis TaxID=329112 RepID=UPI00247ADBB6|nr:lysozyme c-1-like isoform X2 [Toxorhynchites rutilus septentrionalis]
MLLRKHTMIANIQRLIVIIICLNLTVFSVLNEAKVFSKCDLAKELGKNGISRTFYGHWICLANAESGMNTTKINKLPNLTSSYGIFQINSKEWCREGRKGGKCNMKCEDFLDDDLKNDIDCVKKIQMQYGFNGWSVWQKKCKGKELPDISKCNA